uniref:Uncharacterized protein n=1 Tax=Romanomermis culicivorax TaxID=13658 RepID=A0A915IDP5_ROMCU
MFNFFDNDADDLFRAREFYERERDNENLSFNRLGPYNLNAFSDESIPETAVYSQNVGFENLRQDTVGQFFNSNRSGNCIPCYQIDEEHRDPIDYFAHLLKDYDFERPSDSNIYFSSMAACTQNKENRQTSIRAGSLRMQNHSKLASYTNQLPTADPICLTETEDGTFVCTPSKSESSSKSVFRSPFMENVEKPIKSTAIEANPVSMKHEKKLLSLHNLPHPDVILKKKRFAKMFPAAAEPTNSNRCVGLGKDKFSQHLNEVKRRCSLIGDLSRSALTPVASKRSSRSTFQFNLAGQENFGADFDAVKSSLPFCLPQYSSIGKENRSFPDEKSTNDNNFFAQSKFFINPQLSASTSRTAVTEATLLNHFETPAFNNVLARFLHVLNWHKLDDSNE